MNLLELIDKRKQATAKLEGIITNAKSVEKRTFSDDEKHEFAEIELEIENIDKEINERSNKNINTKQINKEIMNKEFRLLGAINDFLKGKEVSDENKEIIETGVRMLRNAGVGETSGLAVPMDFRAITSANSGAVIATQPIGMIDALKANLVLTQAGATVMSGLTGTTVLPRYSGTGAAWEAENVEATDKAGTIDGVTLTPKRLYSTIKVSKQFLMQDGVDAEAYLQNEIVKAIAAKLEQSVFESTAVAGVPAGLFNGILSTGVVGLTVSGTATYANAVKLESTVEGANVPLINPVYITTPKGKGILKTTPVAAGTAKMICELGEVNGYKLLSTSNVKTFVGGAEEGIVFGNFSDLVLANWGVMNLEFEDKPRENSIYITVNSYWDIAKKHNESFAIGTIK